MKYIVLGILAAFLCSCAAEIKKPAGFNEKTVLDLNSGFECGDIGVYVFASRSIPDKFDLNQEKFWSKEMTDTYNTKQYWSLKMGADKKKSKEVCVFDGESLKTAWIDKGKTMVMEYDSKGKFYMQKDKIKIGHTIIDVKYISYDQRGKVEFGCGNFNEKNNSIELWYD